MTCAGSTADAVASLSFQSLLKHQGDLLKGIDNKTVKT
jgi:hypothetical protein